MILEANLVVREDAPVFTSDFSVRQPLRVGNHSTGGAKLGNAYTGQPPHEFGSSMLRSAYPPGGLRWDAMTLFGCAPSRPLDYSGNAGLLWALNGGRLVDRRGSGGTAALACH